MFNIKKILNAENIKQGYRYILISVISYVYVFLSLYVLVDVLLWAKQLSFIIVYGIAYVLLYTIQLKYLFYKNHNKKKFIKYCITILSFYLLANLLYYIGLKMEINYLVTTVFTILILMPLRFLIYKFFVYKD